MGDLLDAIGEFLDSALLAGFIGGLIPSVAAYLVAGRQIRASRKLNRGTLYVQYAIAIRSYVELVLEEHDLWSDLREVEAANRDAATRLDALEAEEPDPGSEACYELEEVTQRSMTLGDDLADIGRRIEQLEARLEREDHELGLVRANMQVFASNEQESRRQVIDHLLMDLAALARTHRASPDEMADSESTLDDAIDLFLEAAKREVA